MRSLHRFPAYLVDARPHEGIVAEVSTDICRDNLSVDAIFGNEILVRTGGARGSLSVVAVSARHDGGRRMEAEFGGEEERGEYG